MDKKHDSASDEKLAQIIAEMYSNDEAINNVTKIDDTKPSDIDVADSSSVSSDDTPIVIEHTVKEIKEIKAIKSNVPHVYHHAKFFGIGHVLGNLEGVIKDPKESEVPEVVITQLMNHGFYCVSSEHYFNKKGEKKVQMKFDRSDGIILPREFGQRFIDSSMKLYTVKIKGSVSKIETFGRVVGFDAPENNVVLPVWMMEQLLLTTGDKTNVRSATMPKITKIKFDTNQYIEKSVAILEHELRDHSVSYIGKQVKAKIFDKEFVLTVVAQEPTYAGVIIGADIDLES